MSSLISGAATPHLAKVYTKPLRHFYIHDWATTSLDNCIKRIGHYFVMSLLKRWYVIYPKIKPSWWHGSSYHILSFQFILWVVTRELVLFYSLCRNFWDKPKKWQQRKLLLPHALMGFVNSSRPAKIVWSFISINNRTTDFSNIDWRVCVTVPQVLTNNGRLRDIHYVSNFPYTPTSFFM